MNDLSVEQSQVAPAPVTVAQLDAQVTRLRAQLSSAAAGVAELGSWCSGLPRRHVPDEHDVLVTDLVQTTVADPTQLQQRMQDVEDLVDKLAAAVGQVRAIVTAETGPFVTVGGFGAPSGAAGTVTVTASCGSLDNATFDRQRIAVRQALTFDDRSRTWSGRLPALLEEAPGRWSALVTAVEAGATVRVQL